MAETKRFYIGYLWWITEPVIDIGVYYVIFGLVLQNKTGDFIPFLLIGTVLWRWIETSVIIGADTLIANRSFNDHVNIPKIIFPTVSLITNSFKFVIVFVLLTCFLLIYGFRIDITWIAIPALLAIEFLFIVCLTYLSAAFMPFFPDYRIILNSILKVGFFLSGIFFQISTLPANLVTYLRLNPAAQIIESFRGVLMHNKWPDWPQLIPMVAVSAIGILIGVYITFRNDTTYPKLSP